MEQQNIILKLSYNIFSNIIFLLKKKYIKLDLKVIFTLNISYNNKITGMGEKYMDKYLIGYEIFGFTTLSH